MLLPVKPPEINAFLLHRVHNLLEHAGHELLVGVDPFDTSCSFRILAQTLCKCRVAFFPMIESFRRMQVKSDLQSFALEIFHELLRIREKAPVPCPSGPSATSFVSVVPVHIHDEHVKRNVICAELIHQSTHFLVGVRPIT